MEKASTIQYNVIRDVDTQIMRILAAFFVILTHSSMSEGFFNVPANIFSRFSVPLFVLISGYYMLSRYCSVKELALKSGKLFVLMLIWSAISLVYSLKTQTGYLGLEFPADVNVDTIIIYLLTEPFHLWYIYAAIGLYFLTPILYVFCKNASKEQFIYALGITFLLGSIVNILVKLELFSLLNHVINQMKIPYMTAFIFLYLLGGYIHKYKDFKRSHVYVLYWAAATAMLAAIVAGILIPEEELMNKVLINFFCPSALLFAAAVFLLIKRIYAVHQIKNAGIRKFIAELADNTLGVYLMHPFVFIIEQIYFSDIYFISSILNAVIAFIVSNIVVYFIRRIPFLRRLAG